MTREEKIIELRKEMRELQKRHFSRVIINRTVRELEKLEKLENNTKNEEE